MLCPHCQTPLEKDPDGIHYICPSCETRFKAKQKTQSKPTPPPAVIPKPKPKAKPKPKPEPEYDEYEDDDDDDFDDDTDNDFDDEEEDDFEPPKRHKQSKPSRTSRPAGSGLNMGIVILAILCIALAAATGVLFFKFQGLKKNYDNLIQSQQSFDDLNSFNNAPEAVDSFVQDPLANEPDINYDQGSDIQPDMQQDMQTEIPADSPADMPMDDGSGIIDDSMNSGEGTTDDTADGSNLFE